MRRSTNPWVVLVLVCFAQFMVILDATIVNIALPTIQRDFHMTETNLQWIVNAYTLTFGGFLLLGGRAGDLAGRKRLFLGGLVVFTVASFLDGIAQNQGMLIASRALQGLGAAFISPAALAIISTTFEEGAARAKAMGVWASIAVGGGAVGLILGGVLTQLVSWRWIFFVNVPVGIAVFALSTRLVPESRDEQAYRSFDVAGAVTVTGGLTALVYGLVGAQQHGWGSFETIGIFIAAAVLLGAFFVIEQRSPAPLVRLSVFRMRSLAVANAVMFLAMAGLFAMFFFNTLYVQRVLHFSPLRTGFAFLPFTVGVMASAGIASTYGTRIGIRRVATAGLLIAGIGELLLARVPVHGGYVADVLPAVVIISFGMGAVFVPITLIATTGLADREQGLASGLFNASQQVGGALGLAILATIAADETSVVNHGAGSAALVDGFHYAYLGGVGFMAAGLVVLVATLRARHVARIEAPVPTAPEAAPVEAYGLSPAATSQATSAASRNDSAATEQTVSVMRRDTT